MGMTRELWSISGLATELGKDRRTIAKSLESVRPDGELRGGKGWYLATALAALTGGASADGKLDPLQERARKDRETADRIAMENELRRGELVEVAEVANQVSKIFAAVRQRLLAVPSKVASRMQPDMRNAVHPVVETEIRDALAELSGEAATKLEGRQGLTTG